MPEKKKKYLTRDQRDNRTAWIMLAPALLFLAVMIAYPLGKVIHDAFSQVNLIKPNVSGFAGLDNFKTILNDEHFWNDAKNTVIWTVCSVAGEYIVGMLAAVLLNQKFKGRAIFRTCVFIPWLVPIIVAGMTWDWMLNTDFGIVNYLLTHLHIVQAPINFLGDARFAMATVIFVNIWRSFPYYTISFLAAMQSIPGDLSEAAAIDGAGMFTRFFRITLPQLKSVSLVIVFIHVIWTAINFDFIWVMTEGGPNYATETLPIMIYRYSMKKFNVGAASALSTMIRSAVPSLLIDNPTIDNFRRVLVDNGFLTYIKNSFVVSLAATLISMIIAVLAGYALSRYYRKRIVKTSNFMMMLSQMIPGVLLLVPLYMIMQQMHMLETHISLVLAYTTFVIPLCTFMMSSFFDTVPIDLEEAAEIDGCSKAKTLIRVILPVSIPSLISTGLYAFINAWNEFMFGYVLISSDKLRTLTPAIMLFKGANLVDWGGLMAASVISVLPVTIIFLFLQKYFLAGLMSGSVKG